MYVERVKRMTMAGKFLWPIPDRKLKKRAYRIATPHAAGLGRVGPLIPPVYAGVFKKYIRNSRVHMIEEAGHMVMYEQPAEFDKVVTEFLKS